MARPDVDFWAQQSPIARIAALVELRREFEGWTVETEPRLPRVAQVPLEPGEAPQVREVRFRTLGCWPVTGATDTPAHDLDELVLDMEQVRYSERAGRLVDGDRGDSMEAKKRAGYF